MRYILTMLIAFHWMTVFAMLAVVSTVEPEHGILAALRFLGATPLHDAYETGGGPLAAALLAFAFAMASVLFLWTLLTVALGDGFFGGQSEAVARRAFGCGVGVLSLLLIGGALLHVSGLFVTSGVALAALLASYLAVYAERWAVSFFAAPGDSDLRAAVRVMAAGAAHSAMLTRLSGRTSVETSEARS
jgi:hypothetical protein